MSEQDVLNQIVKHYKGFADNQIKIIDRYLNGKDGTTDVYGAREAAQELANGLDDATPYLSYPERFELAHSADCKYCGKE